MTNDEPLTTNHDFRVGVGYDIHRLVEGRPLILGGITIPHNKGLLGHSDGDALLHAIADAMLGSLALGDIGRHFPDTDPKFKDADSKKLLEAVLSLVKKNGFVPVNIDSNIIAEEPKLVPHISKMSECVASILKIPAGSVSVKARTNEGLDSIGRGEAMAVHVVVSMSSVIPE